MWLSGQHYLINQIRKMEEHAVVNWAGSPHEMFVNHSI